MRRIPYNSQVTSRVTFKDSAGVLFDPATVEFYLNSDAFTLAAGEVVKESTGVYRYVWTANAPGKVARVWKGTAGGFYAETKREWLEVKRSSVP